MKTMKLVLRLLALGTALLFALVAASQTARQDSAGDLMALENRYMTAMLKANRLELEKLLAPDYLSVAATGDVYNRDQTIGFYRPGELKEATVTDMKVRLYGNTAVVIGRYDQVDKTGEPWSGRFTGVWVRRGDDWLLVSEQFSKLAANQAHPTH